MGSWACKERVDGVGCQQMTSDLVVGMLWRMGKVGKARTVLVCVSGELDVLVPRFLVVSLGLVLVVLGLWAGRRPAL